jgi:hypothetical protein
MHGLETIVKLNRDAEAKEKAEENKRIFIKKAAEKDYHKYNGSSSFSNKKKSR